MTVCRARLCRGPAGGLLLATAGLATLLGGCGLPKAKFIREPYPAPRVVAVLPFANHSNDLRAPVFMQKLAMAALGKGGYAVMRQDEVEEKLKGLGITQGGQLRSRTPAEIAQALGADAVFYGKLTKASHVALGVYLKRGIEVEAEILDAAGVRIWGHDASASSSEIHLDMKDAAEALAWQLAEKWVESIVDHPLYPEMRRSLYRLFMTLPAAGSSRRVGQYISNWRRSARRAPGPPARRRAR